MRGLQVLLLITGLLCVSACNDAAFNYIKQGIRDLETLMKDTDRIKKAFLDKWEWMDRNIRYLR